MKRGNYISIVFYIFISSTFSSYGQVSNAAGQLDITLSDNGAVGAITAFDSRVKSLVGTVFYADDWVSGEVELYNGLIIKNMPINYDIQNNALNLKFSEGIRLLNGESVKNFNINNDFNQISFINCKEFKNNKLLTSGFYKQLSIGKVVILEKVYIKTVKSNYNVALGVGDLNDKLVKEYKYFIFTANEVQKLPKSKKSRLELFKDQKANIDSYIKKESLSSKKVEDLIIIVDYYNSL
jgi:hypothetical protein